MPIKDSGSLTLTEIHTEFASIGDNFGSKPYELSEYRNLPADIGLPTSGEIAFSDFYGKSNTIYVTGAQWIAISSGTVNSLRNIRNCNLWSALQLMGYDNPERRYDITIPANYYLWSNSTSTAGLTVPASMNNTLIIRNSGNIIGCGGAGANSNKTGGNGGPALEILTSASVTIINNSGAYIAAGGGGGDGNRGAGGGGAGGGKGGSGAGVDKNGAGGAGGTLNRSGANGGGASQAGGGKGGGAGGGGGGADNENGKLYDNGAGGGGGGGRILPGAGGAGGGGEAGENGGTGGSGNAGGGAPTSNGGGAGGGWGKSGGQGSTASTKAGAGGQAIKTTNNSVVAYNSGNIWGTV